MKDLFGLIGAMLLLIASDLGAFLIIWYSARKDIKEYLNGKEK